MPKREQKKRSKRGYPLAILIGFDEKRALIWQIFSERVKPYAQIKLDARKNRDKKEISEFHEAIIDAIRPLLGEGVRSVLVTSPVKTDHAELFLAHVNKHHSWLVQQKSPNAVSFGVLVGPASNLWQVQELMKTKKILETMGETLTKETDKIMNVLEKRLNVDIHGENFLFSLKDIEKLILNRGEPEDLKLSYLLLTDTYLAASKQKNRLNTLMQVALNKHVKVRVINEEETAGGKRIAEFGGMVYFTDEEKLARKLS